MDNQIDGHGGVETLRRLAVSLAADADELGLLQPDQSNTDRKVRATRTSRSLKHTGGMSGSQPISRKAGSTLAGCREKPKLQLLASSNPSGGDVGSIQIERQVVPLEPSPGSRSSGSAGTAEAGCSSVPTTWAPQPSKTRRSQKRDGEGDVGRLSYDIQDGFASIATNSRIRRKSDAGPANNGASSCNVLSDQQPSQFGDEADDGGGHPRSESQSMFAAPAAHSADGGCRLGHPCVVDNRSPSVDPALITEIRVLWRMWVLWTSASTKLTLQAKAFCRGLSVDGDKAEADVIYKAALGDGEHPRSTVALAAMLPLIDSRDGIDGRRKEITKQLEKLAMRLPVAGFIKETRGASFKGLAAIIGEAGDLSTYANPGKLWKRFGLAPHAGRAYSTWRMKGGLNADDWTEAGYKPRRRSAVFVIGGSLIGGMGRGKRPLVGQDLDDTDWSPLERLFVERLRYEAARDPENMARDPTKEGKESYSKWAQIRAQRYVEKRFLRLLWQEWRRANVAMEPERSEPDATTLLLETS